MSKRETLLEVTMKILEGKSNNLDELVDTIDTTYTELCSKLKEIILKTYNDLSKLPIPQECNILDKYYGSNAVYNFCGNDLYLYDHDLEQIQGTGSIIGGKYLIIYGLKVGGAYFTSEEKDFESTFKDIKVPLENDLYSYIEPLVNKYNDLLNQLKEIVGKDIYSKYRYLTFICYPELKNGYYIFGIGEHLN